MTKEEIAKMMEDLVTIDWDLVDAVLEAREHGLPPDDNGTRDFIVRKWLTTNGYLDPGGTVVALTT